MYNMPARNLEYAPAKGLLAGWPGSRCWLIHVCDVSCCGNGLCRSCCWPTRCPAPLAVVLVEEFILVTLAEARGNDGHMQLTSIPRITSNNAPCQHMTGQGNGG